MKKILLITFLLIPFVGFTQTIKPIDGFLGIKFGSSKLAAITSIKARGGVVISNKKDELLVNNVKLGKRSVETLIIRFVNNKAYQANFWFRPDVSGHAMDMYNEIVDDFAGVYGSGEVTKKYTDPYSANGDASELELGLLSGKIDYHTDFTDNNNNYIEVEISPIDSDLEIGVSYVSDALTQESEKAEDNKNKSDL